MSSTALLTFWYSCSLSVGRRGLEKGRGQTNLYLSTLKKFIFQISVAVTFHLVFIRGIELILGSVDVLTLGKICIVAKLFTNK